MSENIISIRNLTKTYKLYESNKKRILEGLFPFVKQQHTDFNALSNISFDIKRGEIVGIIGKNGSGKSTLLKIITGVLSPTSGEIEIKGRISALLELGTGFNAEYTGMENIFLSGTLNGISRDEMEKKVDDILDFADIGDFIYQPVKNYSSGMFVRLAFAVAVSVEPEILIVDEALSVGDAAFQAKCMSRMIQIMHSGATVLFVTHDMDIVKRLCERCIYLDHGKIIQEGPAAELADIYLRNARISMNQVNSEIELEDNVDTSFNTNNFSRTVMDAKDIEDAVFCKKVERFREGDGKVKAIRVAVTNTDGISKNKYDYDEKIIIKIFIKFDMDCTNVAIGYHIRDEQNTEIIGSGFLIEKSELIQGKKDEIYCIEYETHLPLCAGAYNLTVVVSSPIIGQNNVIFHDLIENAVVFEISERVDAKIWNKVYIPNKLNVSRIECE